MSVVVDASVIVSALLDDERDGRWAESILESHTIVAPAHMPVEVAHILRRAFLKSDLAEDLANLAHRDLLRLPVELFDYEPLGERAWELRDTVTPYDAWYVALAEWREVPLATLDLRLSRAPGPLCEFLTPTLG